MFSIEIEGFPELQAEWRAGSDALVKDLQAGAARANDVATDQIKALVPKKTRKLEKSVRPHLRKTPNGASGDITIGAGLDGDYASYVLEGTPPHPIVSKSVGVGGRLKFEIGGRTLFRRGVNHPGTKPNDFVSGGVVEGQQVLDHDADAAVKKLKARIEG